MIDTTTINLGCIVLVIAALFNRDKEEFWMTLFIIGLVLGILSFVLLIFQTYCVVMATKFPEMYTLKSLFGG